MQSAAPIPVGFLDAPEFPQFGQRGNDDQFPSPVRQLRQPGSVGRGLQRSRSPRRQTVTLRHIAQAGAAGTSWDRARDGQVVQAGILETFEKCR